MRLPKGSVSTCCYKVFPPLVGVFLLSLVAAAQSAAPKYDPSTEMKMKGVVEELKLPPKGKDHDVAHLVMKNGDQMVDIYLCPKSFMDEMGVSFTAGDEIAFTGSKVKDGGDEMILAREVVKGQDTLVLRDDKGNPVWAPGH